ncbi:MAG: UDP-2,3-diacylglucosamine pyrophosphatase LpxI [Chlamydiae bacterium]|nr:UDP-2,3-diacylglucosamine pyrophosphatase LpxI [Chlamydiota bacterium]
MAYIALLAGQGVMPRHMIDEIHSSGKKVLLIAIRGVTPEQLVEKADSVDWIYITQIGKARRLCLKYKVTEAVFAGLVHHSHIFNLSLFRLDWLTIKILLSLKDFRANAICNRIIKCFEEKKVQFMSTTKILRKYLAPQGILTRRKPNKKQMADVEFGLSLARELGRLDIGQTVVVKNKSVVALEAMEGTDKCLQRAGDIAGPGCVVIKLPKPNQDSRFDVPVIGKNTIEKLAKIKGSVLAIGANQTFILDSEVPQLADEFGIVLLSIEV